MKIKIFLLLLFLIVLFTLLRIKKLEKKNIYLTLTKNLEYFQDQNGKSPKIKAPTLSQKRKRSHKTKLKHTI